MRQPFIDLAFTTAGVDVEIMERPGRWMPDDRLAKLSADLRSIAAETLASGALTYGVFSGQAEPLAKSTITLVKDPKTGAPLAFNALVHIEATVAQKPLEIIHLGLVMIDPNVRSKGLSWILYGLTCVLLFLRAGLRPCYVSNVTQVPAVVGMVSETFSEVTPTPARPTPQDFSKILVAREIMAHHRTVFGVGSEAEFDEATFIIQNAYTGGSDDLKKTFEDATKHRDEAYNSWCDDILDYERGDDVLQIGLIDLAAAQRYVFRMVPRRSLLGIGVVGLWILVQRAIIPALQWFDTKRDFGRLRAR